MKLKISFVIGILFLGLSHTAKAAECTLPSDFLAKLTGQGELGRYYESNAWEYDLTVSPGPQWKIFDPKTAVFKIGDRSFYYLYSQPGEKHPVVNVRFHVLEGCIKEILGKDFANLSLSEVQLRNALVTTIKPVAFRRTEPHSYCIRSSNEECEEWGPVYAHTVRFSAYYLKDNLLVTVDYFKYVSVESIAAGTGSLEVTPEEVEKSEEGYVKFAPRK